MTKRIKRGAVAGAAQNQFSKASEPKVSFHKRSERWRLRSNYYSKKGVNGKMMEATGYPTEEAAEAEKMQFWVAADKDGAKHWKNWSKDATDQENKARNCEHYIYEVGGTPKKQCLGDLRLNAAEQQAYGRVKRRCGVKISRTEFNELLNSGGHESVQRFIRANNRRYAAANASQSVQDRYRYLVDTRLENIKELLKIEVAKQTLLAGKVVSPVDLVIRDGESVPRSGSRADDFSSQQVNRVTTQAIIVSMLIGKRIAALKEEETLIQQLKREVEEEKEEGSSAMEKSPVNEALIKLKQQRSTLMIVTETCLDLHFTQQPSTVLDWWREFNRMGGKGFLEDMRGKHERSNWLEEAGLVGTLKLWLSITKPEQISVT